MSLCEMVFDPAWDKQVWIRIRDIAEAHIERIESEDGDE